MKVHRCTKCGFDAVDLEQALQHLKEEHPEFLADEDDVLDFVESAYIPNSEVIETIKEGETENLQYNGPPSGTASPVEVIPYKKKKEYPYPEPPYYSDGITYTCKTCNLSGISMDELFQHLLSTHPSDVKKVISFYLQQKIIRDHLGKSKTEHLTDEQVSRWADTQMDAILRNLELEQNGPDALQAWLSNTSLPTMKDFVTGKRDSCPLCGLTSATFSIPDLQTQYKHNQILAGLRKTNPSLQKLSINDMKDIHFSAKWQGHDVSLGFLNNLHLSLKHSPSYHELIPQTLSGSLPVYLASFSIDPVKENLTVLGLGELEAAKDKVSWEIKAYLTWWNSKRHVIGNPPK